MDTDDLIEPGTGGRTASELATLLLELGRIVKARRFYGAGDPRLAPIFERGLRAWRADLERRGTLDLEILKEGFRERAGHGVLSHMKLADLQGDLLGRDVRRVRFAAEIDAEALAAFAEVLAASVAELRERGGFGPLLYARVPEGIVVNGVAPGTPSDAPDPSPPPAAAPPPGEQPALTLDVEPAPPREEPPEELEFLDDRPPAPPSAPEPAAEPEPELELADLDGAATDEDTDPLELEGENLFDRRGVDLHADFDEPPAEGIPGDAPPAARSDGDDLAFLLREMESCDEVSSYLDLARQVSRIAEQATESGRHDVAYGVLGALANQAAGKGSERQRDVAQSFLSSLAQGARLEDLVERACAPSQGDSVRASQILLQIGDPVVRHLLDAADRARDAARRGHLHGVLIAMGEKIMQELLRRMAEEEDLEAVKTAIRLTGETQNPDGVPRLTQLLAHSAPSVREEAAKALVRVGSERAIDALIRSLRSKTEGLPELAIYCLGATGQERAVAPLVQVLQEAVDERQVERGREVIRALGRLGRPEATRALAELLLRKSVMGRRGLRDLKIAAAAVLGGLAGDEAVGALAQAARSRDPQLRRAAQTALDRRAHAFARSGGASVRAIPGAGH